MRTYEGPNMSFQEPNQALDFLMSPANFSVLMPENNQEFSATETGFSFQLKGMPAIHLEKQEANGETFYQNKGGSVDFSLHIVNAVSFRFEVRGNINPMMHMMLQKPLKKLLEDFSTKLSQRYS